MLVYLFLGVSVLSDIFMSSICVIAGATKLVQTRDKLTGEIQQKDVAVWNNTVASLTLMVSCNQTLVHAI